MGYTLRTPRHSYRHSRLDTALAWLMCWEREEVDALVGVDGQLER